MRGLGYSVVEVGGLYKIVPEADAKLQAGTVSVGARTNRGGDQVLTHTLIMNSATRMESELRVRQPA